MRKKKISTTPTPAKEPAEKSEPIFTPPWPVKTLPSRPNLSKFSPAAKGDLPLHFARLLKSLFSDIVKQKPATVLQRNTRRFSLADIFDCAVNKRLFGDFKNSTWGGITLKDNKIEFLQELSPFLTDNTPTVLENASFRIRQGKTLFNVTGVGLGLKRISDETFHLVWECMEIIELPKPCDFRLEEIKQLEKRSNGRTITLKAEKLTTKTRQDIENAVTLLGNNNPENLKSRINKVLGSTNAKTNVEIRLPSSKVRSLKMKSALAQLFPPVKISRSRKKTPPTQRTIYDRKKRLLEFLADCPALDTYWTEIPADREVNLREVDWLVHQLKPSKEVLISIWEEEGMPIRVFNILREELPGWWRKKNSKTRSEIRTKKKETQVEIRKLKVASRKLSRWGKKVKKDT
jgi:hypothetical protein